jgi:CheY-like chemotaxis protein
MQEDFTTWRVLVVDDDPDNLNLMAELLEFRGAQVCRAESGEEGLSALEGFKPTVILLDLSMPGMDGWELHRQLRVRPDLSQIPIIAITALAMPDDLARAKEEGFYGYITKPYRIKALVDELAELVSSFHDGR